MHTASKTAPRSGTSSNSVLGDGGRAKAAGASVNTETNRTGPKGRIGQRFLARSRLGETGCRPSSLTYARTGERSPARARAAGRAADDTGGWRSSQLIDEDDPAERQVL